MKEINWRKKYFDLKLSGVFLTGASMLVAYGLGSSKEIYKYKEATPIVRDINQDGRNDISLVNKDGKILQTYLQPEDGFDAGKENASELEKKASFSEGK